VNGISALSPWAEAHPAATVSVTAASFRALVKLFMSSPPVVTFEVTMVRLYLHPSCQ